MTVADRVTQLFEDAQGVHQSAMERMAQGDIRDAAEKAWCATKRATDALILAHLGTEPQSAGGARRGLATLCAADSAFETLQGDYHRRSELLHVNCFYDGNCEPEQYMMDLIRDTSGYIRNAEELVHIS